MRKLTATQPKVNTLKVSCHIHIQTAQQVLIRS